MPNPIYQQFYEWLSTPLGQALLQAETKLILPYFQCILGEHLLLLGDGDMRALTARHLLHHQIVVSEAESLPVFENKIVAEYDALPILPYSMQAVVMPHVLEFAAQPHQVLREAEGVLAPEGYLLLFGFHPWGVFRWRRFLKGKKRPPDQGQYRMASRVLDWLQLLNFHIVDVKRTFYLPPINRRKWLSRGRFLNWILPYLFPFVGGVYLIVAQKKVLGRVQPKSKWETLAEVVPNQLAKPLAGGVRRDRSC